MSFAKTDWLKVKLIKASSNKRSTVQLDIDYRLVTLLSAQYTCALSTLKWRREVLNSGECMLLVLRLILVALFMVLLSIFGSFYCLFRPRNPILVSQLAHWFAWMGHRILGIKTEVRVHPDAKNIESAVYIANHQSNLDMVTLTKAVQPRTVTIGKKSLVWLPFFGILYWLTGNILIDRANRSKAVGTIEQVAEKIKSGHLSVMMFPEGTRSRGRGLLPFKTGAFHTAMAAGVPIVPICVSSTNAQLKLNRWDNGKVIVETLAPVDSSTWQRSDVRQLAEDFHETMLAHIKGLDEELGNTTPLHIKDKK